MTAYADSSIPVILSGRFMKCVDDQNKAMASRFVKLSRTTITVL